MSAENGLLENVRITLVEGVSIQINGSDYYIGPGTWESDEEEAG